MKQIVLAIIVFITYSLQTTIIPHITLWGFNINLFLVVVCLVAILFGSTSGAVVGGVLGIMGDFYQGHSIGLYAIILLYLGIFIGGFRKKIFKDNYIVVFLLIIITTIIYQIITYVYAVFIYAGSFDVLHLFIAIGVESMLNLVAGIIIYPILMKVHSGLEQGRHIFGN